MYPLSVIYGGFEHQCVQTCKALAELGCEAKLLDWNNPGQDYEILHLFGQSPCWHEISHQASGKYRLVISVLGASTGPRGPLEYLKLWAGSASAMLRQPTRFQLIRETLAQGRRVVCLNNADALYFHTSYRVPMERLALISNGVAAGRFCGDKRLFAERHGISAYVLFVGNIVARKNPLRLAQILARRGWPGVFIGGALAGERAYAEEFEAMVESAPQLKWVRTLEYDDPLLASAYAGARVFCLPSANETQPLSALEAMAAGVPVILGNKRYAHEAPFEKAVRCNPESAKEIEAAIEKVLAVPERYQARLPEKYRWDEVGKQLVKLYGEVLAE
jgi:glycosyltransferase involved in cell wall biosynthesis